MRSPVIRFDSVAGCEMPMVTNVCSSFDRVAKSVGVTADVLTARLVAAMDSGVPPVPVTAEQAPAREKRYKRGEFSLRQLPELFYTDTQTDPYITSSLVIARDPESGAHNLSFHRLMISGDNIATIYMTPGGHLDQIWKRNCFAGRPTPVAAVIGTHPLWCYASLVSGPLEHDDYSVVGAVLGSGIELTAGLVDPDLMLPARAELILEGLIDPVETKSEGPFGEFLGYVAERDIRPVVTFLSLTTRIEPIYQDIVAGQIEHITMSSIGLRARLHRDYFRNNPAVTDFWTLFLAIDIEKQPDFSVEGLMRRLLESEAYLKQVYCFDKDVDLRKQTSVQSAIACFVQADRDVIILEECPGNGVDPSEIDGKTTKIAVNACAKGEALKSQLPAELVKTFDLDAWIE